MRYVLSCIGQRSARYKHKNYANFTGDHNYLEHLEIIINLTIDQLQHFNINWWRHWEDLHKKGGNIFSSIHANIKDNNSRNKNTT